jgi:hypothetical protein
MKMVRRILLACLIALIPAAALAARNPDELDRVSFSNRTGYRIVHLFYSPEDSELWGPDILASKGALADGEVLSFFVHHPDQSIRFDFLALDSSGDGYLIPGVEISRDRPAFVPIGLEHFDRSVRGSIELTELIITNASDDDIWYLFISPADSLVWGIDILDDETIFATGDSFAVRLPSAANGSSFDLLGMDENNGTLYRSITISNRREEWFIDITEADRR